MAEKPTSKNAQEQTQQIGTLNGEKSVMDELPGITTDTKQFGMKPRVKQELRGTGANLVEFEKFLVKPKIISIPSPYPGVPATARVSEVSVMEMTQPKRKIEPDLVNGNFEKGITGLNQLIIFKDSKVPFQYLFPAGSVNENEKLKAKSEMITMKDGSRRDVLFMELRGGETLETQIRNFKEKYAFEF